MSTELQVVELPEELAKIASTETSLSKDKADAHLMAFAPFFAEMTEASNEIETINFEDPTDADASKARTVRLRLAKNRTASEKEKDARKKGILSEGNLIQAAYNLIANASKMKEESLAQVEKFQQLKEEKRIADLENVRREMLAPFDMALPEGLGKMTDEVFSAFFNGCKKQHEDKLEAERLRVEAEAKAKEIRELNEARAKEIRPLWHYMTNEESETVLGELTPEAFESLKKVLEDRDADHKREADLKEKELAQERERAKAQEEAAKKEAEAKQAELDKALKAQQEAEAELKRKEAQEAQEKAEAEAKAKAEEKARKAAERKAKNAPEKTKLEAFYSELVNLTPPVLKTEEGEAAMIRINDSFEKFRELVRTLAEGL